MHFGNGIISLGIYILSAFAFYKLGKLRGIQNSWLAFLPIFQLFIIGSIGDTLKYNNNALSQRLFNVPLAYVLPGAAMVASFSYMIPLIGGLVNLALSLALFLGQVLVYYMVFDRYASPNMTILFTLASLIPVVGPILILYCLKDEHAY